MYTPILLWWVMATLYIMTAIPFIYFMYGTMLLLESGIWPEILMRFLSRRLVVVLTWCHKSSIGKSELYISKNYRWTISTNNIYFPFQIKPELHWVISKNCYKYIRRWFQFYFIFHTHQITTTISWQWFTGVFIDVSITYSFKNDINTDVWAHKQVENCRLNLCQVEK